MGRVHHAWVLFLAAVILLCAGAPAIGKEPTEKAPPGTPEVEKLREAYMTLYKADHDYHGHRIKAMHELEKACDHLGTDIRGDGHGHERQAVSDEELRKARAIIDEVLHRDVIKGHKEAKFVLHHLEKAIKNIDEALRIH